MGLNYKIRDNLLIGTRIGYAETKTKFVADEVKLKSKNKQYHYMGFIALKKTDVCYASAVSVDLNTILTVILNFGLATIKKC